MKALVLAAGKGERLRPLTDRCPKPMVPVAGKPLLERIVHQLRDAGITELFINLHHCPETVKKHFGDGKCFGVQITYSEEPELLGTAGAAKKLESQFQEPFIVYYGDNYVEIDLLEMASFHQTKGGIGTIAVFPGEEVSAGGVVEMDVENRIHRFVEKPAPGSTSSRMVNAGIYFLEPAIFPFIPSGIASDFGKQIFPALLSAGKELYAYSLSGTVIGVDTPALLSKLESYLSGGASS